MPKKNYNNRAIKTEVGERENVYFFPKANPPVSIRAKTREGAEEKLKANKN